eukprot:2353663-Rhodomonas_salina.1
MAQHTARKKQISLQISSRTRSCALRGGQPARWQRCRLVLGCERTRFTCTGAVLERVVTACGVSSRSSTSGCLPKDWKRMDAQTLRQLPLARFPTRFGLQMQPYADSPRVLFRECVEFASRARKLNRQVSTACRHMRLPPLPHDRHVIPTRLPNTSKFERLETKGPEGCLPCWQQHHCL